MRRTCVTCYFWRPISWDKWHYVDEEAPCACHENALESRNHCCDGYSVTKPAVNVNHRSPRQNNEVAMEDWDSDDWDVDLPTYTNKDKGTINDEYQIKEYAHQDEAFDRFKDSNAFALFLEQGLGKSAVALRIAAYRYKRGDIQALCIIAPNNVHRQWAREQIPLWLNHYDCPYELAIIGGKSGVKYTRPFSNVTSLKIVCVNVDTFSTPSKWKDVTEWANTFKTMIVLDEATTIKNIKAQRTEHILYSFNKVTRYKKSITSSVPRSVCRAILTGTPVTNGPFDLWTMMEFVSPNYFKRNYWSFRNHYGMFHTLLIDASTPEDKAADIKKLRKVEILINEEIWAAVKEIKTFNEAHIQHGVTESTYNYIQAQDHYEGPYKFADELKEKIAPISMTRTLEECVDMPGQTYNKRRLEMGKDQARVYKEMEKDLIATYNERESTASSKLTALIRLQQITSGFISSRPIIDPEEDIRPSNDIIWIGNSNPKLDMLYDEVEVACTINPVIIITRFSCEAARIYEDLSKRYPVCLQTGWKKVGDIEGFQNGRFPIMVANLRVISRGFNLQNSHQMFIYSNTFSLEDRLQVESRIYRIGQQRRCEYTDYLYDDTIDMKIVAALRQKRSLLDYIRGVSMKSFLTEWDEVAQTEYSEEAV